MKPPRPAPIAALLCALLLASCGPRGARVLDLPADSPLSSSLGWGLISESYVRLKTERRIAASDIAHLRDKSLVEVVGRESGEGKKPGTSSLWYLIKAEEGEGWVRDSELLLFSSKVQAERARDEQR